MKRKTLFFILILCITPGKCWHIDKCWQSFDRKTAHRRTESLAYFSYIHWIKHNCLIINANWNGHLELPLTTSPLISSHYVYTQQMENMYYRFCHRQVNQTTPVVKNNAKTFLRKRREGKLNYGSLIRFKIFCTKQKVNICALIKVDGVY